MIKIKIGQKFIFTIFLALFAFTLQAQAGDGIDVEYPVGDNIHDIKIFDENNIYPGCSSSKTIRVENDNPDEAVDLDFTFEVKGDKTLAKMLKIYVVRVSDGSYRIGGEGDRFSLSSASGKHLFVDRLSPTKGKEYRIKVVFDKEAGNEYQNLQATFDIEFDIESNEASDQTPEQILASEGRFAFTGLAPSEDDDSETAVEGEQTQEPKLVAAVSANESGAGVAGAKTQCLNLPFWIWVIQLLIVISFLLINDYVNFSKKIYRWKFDLVIVLAAIGFWYFFDNCRQFEWFFNLTISSSLFIHFIYISHLKRAANEKQTQTEN